MLETWIIVLILIGAVNFALVCGWMLNYFTQDWMDPCLDSFFAGVKKFIRSAWAREESQA